MKIRPKNIIKYQQGKKVLPLLGLEWYSGFSGFNPEMYESDWDYDRGLVAGDLSNGIKPAWKSDISGYDLGRYLPTTGHGNFGLNKEHFNYTKNVEEKPYYNGEFGNNILTEDGTLFTPMGEKWARAVDKLLPPGSKASFFDENNRIRKIWKTLYKDVHGRSPKTFLDLKSYVNWVRNDQTLGARHNVFIKTGKRYFYKNKDGELIWVNPNEIDGYTISNTPIENFDANKMTLWKDYELTGLNDATDPTKPEDVNKTNGGSVETGEKDDPESPWEKMGAQLKNAAPGILEMLRLKGGLDTNLRVYDTALKGIRPNLQLSYNTYRQVVGDEATKQAYYRRAAQGQTKAALPFTSDADRQMAYLYEAKRIGDELRAQGDLADNQRIRETSAESSAHADANIERATQVANSNTVEINKANADKWNLLALKHLADWTSWDNYLLANETRLREKNLFKEKLRQLSIMLLVLDYIDSDKDYQAAIKNLENIRDEYVKAGKEIDLTNSKVKDAIKARLRAYNKAMLRAYQMYAVMAKKGTKLKYEQKEDLLYKTARDAANHFVKMSKIVSDANIKSRTKPIKLVSHPKKKLQQGGVAPFYVFRPATVGGSSSITTDLSGNSSKSSEGKADPEKAKLDLVKDLFKQMKGLPIDTNLVYKNIYHTILEARLFGTELSTDDIASMYLSSMNYLSKLLYSKEMYDKAMANADNNEALNEFAITTNGKLVAKDNEDEGKIVYISPSEIKENSERYLILTNNELLWLRAYSPSLAFEVGDSLMAVVNNGVGLNKVSKLIKELAGKLGADEEKLEGISKVESNQIKAGLKILAGTAGTPDGYYLVSNDIKSSAKQVEAALTYIYSVLPSNYKTLLDIHSGGHSKDLIKTFLISLTGDYSSQDITPLTEKDSLNEISSNPLLARQREIGGVPQRYNIVTRDSNTRISVNGTYYPSNPKIKDDTSIDNYLYESGISGIMDSKYGITFGDLQISPENLKDIMYSNTGEMIATLPCKIVNGHKLVNLEIKNLYEEAEQAALKAVGNRNSELFIKKLGEELLKRHLDLLLDQNGLPNKNMFGLFLIVEAYATDNIKLDENSLYVEKVKDPDEELEKRLSKALSTDSKKSDYKVDVKDKWLLFEWGYNNVYRGSVFIPINNNPNAAMLSWGTSTKIGQQQDLEELFQIENKSIKYNSDNNLN